jgi:hypothetical protein
LSSSVWDKGEFVRQSARLGFALILAFCALCAAVPSRAANNVATVSANVVKPLILTRVQDLDLGTIVLGPGTWSNAIVGISRAGVFNCTNANLTCSGATKAATYNVSGSNNRVVGISAPSVTLVNQSNSAQTLIMVLDTVPNLTLTNSGPPGSDFSVGGSITLSSSTGSGIYSGTLNVTVDYQ